MPDRFGEWTIGISLILLTVALILIWPLGSVQMDLIVAYLFATPLLGGLLYLRSKGRWKNVK